MKLDTEADDKLTSDDNIRYEMRGPFADICSKLDALYNKQVRWSFTSSILYWRFFLYLSVDTFGLPPLTVVVKIIPKTDV